MTLVNARAAIEAAINTAVTDADGTVSVVFDNMPFTTPGKTKKYVLVTINFDQATIQAHGAAVDQYAGTVQCGIFTSKDAALDRASVLIDGCAMRLDRGLVKVDRDQYVLFGFAGCCERHIVEHH